MEHLDLFLYALLFSVNLIGPLLSHDLHMTKLICMLNGSCSCIECFVCFRLDM